MLQSAKNNLIAKWKKAISQGVQSTSLHLMESKPGTMMFQSFQPVTKSKELLFQYIVNYGITNGQHYNKHLKYQTLLLP